MLRDDCAHSRYFRFYYEYYPKTKVMNAILDIVWPAGGAEHMQTVQKIMQSLLRRVVRF